MSFRCVKLQVFKTAFEEHNENMLAWIHQLSALSHFRVCY